MNLIKLASVTAFLTLSAFACKNGEKTAATAQNTPPAAQNQSPAKTDESTWNAADFKAAHAFENADADSVQGFRQVKRPPQQNAINIDEIKPPNTSRRAYLNTGWWFPKMAHQPSDSTIHRQYLGKFLKFREDQTFDIIQNGKVVETGRWNFDDDKYVVYISCKDPYLNNTWKVMEKGFTMIWLGQTSLNFSGIQVRWDNQKTAPPGF